MSGGFRHLRCHCVLRDLLAALLLRGPGRTAGPGQLHQRQGDRRHRVCSAACLCALPDGGQHLRCICHRWLSGGCILLYVPSPQAAHPAAHPLLSAELPGRDHPHDPDHSATQPAHPVPTVQHSHNQLQLGRRGQLHAPLLSGGSGLPAAAARLSRVRHNVLGGVHPHTDSTPAAPIHLPSGPHVRRRAAPAPQPHTHPAAAPPADPRIPPAPAVLLPSAARHLHSRQGLCRLWTELTELLNITRQTPTQSPESNLAATCFCKSIRSGIFKFVYFLLYES